MTQCAIQCCGRYSTIAIALNGRGSSKAAGNSGDRWHSIVTALTLLVLPVLYRILHRRDAAFG